MRPLPLALAVLLTLPVAAAACPSDAEVDAFAAAVGARTPASPPVAAGADMAVAVCAQDMLLDRLRPDLGAVVGWKAGLTSAPAQARFGVSEPVLGTLLEGMMLPDGARVTAAEAVNPLFEADLVVELAAPVPAGTAPADVLPLIAGIRPFLELPDLPFPAGAPIDGPILTAANVGAWRGVLGDLIPIPAGAEGMAMLETFTARLTDADGAELSAAPGSAVLGHPLAAVAWVADKLAERGLALGAGDLVSVGSIGPLHPMKPGMTVTMTYDGLPGTPTLSASFD